MTGNQQNQTRRVVVTGLGVISALGNDPEQLFSELMRSQSAVRLVRRDGPTGYYEGLAAPLRFDPAEHFSGTIKVDHLDRATQFSLAAASAAIRDSRIQFDGEVRDRSGVSLGLGMGASSSLEESYTQLLLRDPNRLKPLTVLTVMNNAAASHISMSYGLRGSNHTYSCACASSAVAVGEAFRQIRHGYADVMVAGGTEAMLTFSCFKAWEAMRILAVADRDDPSSSCRPFSSGRSGLVLGEGAAMLVLEERNAALERGAYIYAELMGYGSANDPGHITRPSVAGQAQAMAQALGDAGMDAGEIDYINAHGTGTVLNDVTETGAIKQVFGERAYKIPVSSTKSMHGHLLGAAGALELLISIVGLKQQAVPPTAHLETPDPECDLDYVAGGGRTNQAIKTVMSNSFAFGGTNAVIIAGDGNRE